MNYVKRETGNFFVHTPSNVDFKLESSSTYSAMIDNRWKLPLGGKDPITGLLRLGVDQDDLKQDFLTGRFFIVDDHIIDHRLGSQLKFEHSADNVKQLADHLGFSSMVHTNVLTGDTHASTRAVAHSQTEAFDCNISNSQGGQMDIKLGFSWSPFELNIKAVIEMWRQVCSNGAIAQSPLLDCMVPMMNRWKENLATSNRVIRHNFDKIVLPRLEALPNERINLADVQLMGRILNDFAESKRIVGHQKAALDEMIELVDMAGDIPGAHKLGQNQLKFVEAPMTAYDAYNMITEANTHLVGADRNTSRGQAFISGLLFNDQRKRAAKANLDDLVIGTTTMANPDQAFWGITQH